MPICPPRNVTGEIAEALGLGDDVLSIQLNFMPDRLCTAVVIKALTNDDIEKAKAILQHYELRPMPEKTRYLAKEHC